MDEDCKLSIELHSSVLLQSSRWIQIITSICSIALVLYICIHHLSRTILDRVSIAISKTVYLNILAYSFCFGVVQVAQVIASLSAATPCEVHIPKILCLFRMLAGSVSNAFVLLHLSITIQQALSTFRYPLKVQSIVATLCIFITFIIFNLKIMIALDIINFIFTIFLVVYNRKILKNERNSFDLSRTFQRMQNVYTMEPFIPVFSLHSIVHFVHVMLYSFTIYNRPYYTHAEFTILHSVANLVPYYCLIAPLAFLIVIKLGRILRQGHLRSMVAPKTQSNIQEVCFKNLKEAWDKQSN